MFFSFENTYVYVCRLCICFTNTMPIPVLYPNHTATVPIFTLVHRKIKQYNHRNRFAPKQKINLPIFGYYSKTFVEIVFK